MIEINGHQVPYSYPPLQTNEQEHAYPAHQRFTQKVILSFFYVILKSKRWNVGSLTVEGEPSYQ